MIDLDIYTLVGFVGMGCIIGAYAYLTWNDEPNPFVLHGTNLTGAVLLTVSLLVHTNWPSLVLEDSVDLGWADSMGAVTALGVR